MFYKLCFFKNSKIKKKKIGMCKPSLTWPSFTFITGIGHENKSLLKNLSMHPDHVQLVI